MTRQRTNDEEILALLIKEEKARFSSLLSDSEFFEIFAAQQVLKDRDLSDSEILAGNIGKGNDGGVDGLYFFINGKLILDDIASYDSWVKDVSLEIYIIQAKTSSGFGEDAIYKLINVTDDLFTLSNNLDDKKFKRRYHPKLLEIAKRIIDGYKHLVTKKVNLKFHYVYASQGNRVEDNTFGLTHKVEQKLKALFSNAAFEFTFLGAKELAHIASKTPNNKKEIEYIGQVLYSTGSSCVCLVKNTNFYRFLRDDSTNEINRHIFEANVRDYQGDVGVNKEIRDTLENPGEEDFWWLNNGITILTPSMVPKGNIALILDTPKIVNGLQTSNEIYNYYSSVSEKELNRESRSVLLRIIVCAEDDPRRDKIIKATNSQTKIPALTLKATDQVHWNIEAYLKERDLYYDRRKNFYKNQGKPQSKIVSITELAQAMLAIRLARPDDARARPSSILTDQTDYERVFSVAIPLSLYYAVLQIMEKIEVFFAASTLSANEKTNLRYYLALYSVCLSQEVAILNDEAILKAANKLTESDIAASLSRIKPIYELAGGDDNAAKGTDFREAMEMDLLKRYMPKVARAKAKAAKKFEKDTGVKKGKKSNHKKAQINKQAAKKAM
ncbi:AIPR family protein [Chitinophaga sp. CB10]|uniref:AIPR family protein n=1 Tax=Chitinophaga sp. CB10 TaxID=1891659 RepID=UPI000A745428|nr:AIPR family protein [Chitinophaga sp. CB10]